MNHLFKAYMFVFPKLTGNYNVGTVTHYIKDLSRQEILSTNQNEQRQLILQFWYPIEENEQKIAPYAPEIREEWKNGLKQSKFPENNIREIDQLFSHAIQEEKPLVSKQPFPIILFSHGYVALRSAYSTYCEDLASHGYIVVGICHTYYCQIAKFPEKIIYALPEHLSQKKLIHDVDSVKEQNYWVQDVKCVIEYIKTLNHSIQSNFHNLLDTKNIGIFGHSFGGSTAITMARIDNHIKAAVDLDGGLFGDENVKEIKKPIMFIVGQDSMDDFTHHTDEEIAHQINFDPQIVKALRQKYYTDIPQLFKKSKPSYLISIAHAKHAAFSDWVILKHLPLYAQNKAIYSLEQRTGSIDGFLMTKIITYYVSTFFDIYLKKENKKITTHPWMQNLVTINMH